MGSGERCRTTKERLAKWTRLPNGNGCMYWTGARSDTGYGSLRHLGRSAGAHVVAYVHAHGPLPPGCLVRHTCDNRGCVAPDHLIPGTYTDNLNDRIARHGHHMAARQACPKGHVYSEANTYVWRGRRLCRMCRKSQPRRS